jgi:hypothetical protein
MLRAMRRIGPLTAALLALACGTTTAGSDMTEKMTSFAERYTVAWCGGEPPLVAAFFAPEGSLAVNGGDPAVGREAIAEIAHGFMSAFPDLVLHFDGLEQRDGRLLFHWTFEGTNSGPGGSGQFVRFSGHESWLIGEDGLIAESLGTYDEAEYQRQLEHGYAGD